MWPGTTGSSWSPAARSSSARCCLSILERLAPYAAIFGLSAPPAVCSDGNEIPAASRRHPDIHWSRTDRFSPAGWEPSLDARQSVATVASASRATSPENGPCPATTATAAAIIAPRTAATTATTAARDTTDTSLEADTQAGDATPRSIRDHALALCLTQPQSRGPSKSEGSSVCSCRMA